MKIRPEDALEYHSSSPAGKLSVIPTKPCRTQRDLSLAYTPGVAVPCLEIERDPSLAYKYTAKGNLVGVVSNGTAVLGLGNIGALAGKPVMEGKAVLFKRFADIDVFDIELDTKDPEEIIRTCQILEPTFGGINLEDIKAPECFYIEETLRKTMKIPVFHDDQHGTAIISGAGLINALELGGKKIEDIKVVFNGAGAAAISCAAHYVRLGVRLENIVMCDTKGVIFEGRTEHMNPYKARYASKTSARTLQEAMVGADVFFGLSQAGCVTQDMVRGMAPNPIIFAMANPDPEITYDDALAARPDAIVATGRSDYPNQVNNVLGFPFIFRGALDVRATTINDEMKLAATLALASLAKEDVPDSVLRAYSIDRLEFGREYIIPKPFDPRVLIWEASAVAQAAMETGVAQQPVDLKQYREELEKRLGKADEVMRGMINKAQRQPKRIVFTEGEESKILRACQILLDEKIAVPILLGNAGEDPRHDRGIAPAPQRRADCRAQAFRAARRVHRGVLQPAAAQGHHAHRSRTDHPEPHHVRQYDGAAQRCRRADRRADHALSRHHPPGAAGDRRPPRAAPGGRRVRDDHAEGRHLLPGRRHGEHRADGGGSGGDRDHGGREGAALQPGAARGHAQLLQLRQHAPRALRQGAARGGPGPPEGAGADDRWRDAGRYRGDAADHRRDVPVQHAEGRGQCADLPEPGIGEHRLQAAAAGGRCGD